MTRRDTLLALVASGAAVATCARPDHDRKSTNMSQAAFAIDPATAIERITPLGFPYETRDPFLFCAHHDDLYPAANEELGPKASLVGRRLGQDFELRDGFRMYHGDTVPGFPRHPHRGFETVTLVRRGYVDHSDSMGARGRYGNGDVQWMTAGAGVEHAEMFPLLDPNSPNRTELFQIWLNLPARNKLVPPHFQMLWGEQVPRREMQDAQGRRTQLTLVAGAYDTAVASTPPPSSWASHADSDVAIWMLKMEGSADFILPPARAGSNRSLYFFEGTSLRIGSRVIPASQRIDVRADAELPLHAGAEGAEVLLLQGRPIGEPVVQYGPFVMNTKEEIVATIREYQRSGFGRWPWPRPDPVHGAERVRFALHADGRREEPKA